MRVQHPSDSFAKSFRIHPLDGWTTCGRDKILSSPLHFPTYILQDQLRAAFYRRGLVGSCFKSSDKLKYKDPHGQVHQRSTLSQSWKPKLTTRCFNAEKWSLYVQRAPVIQTYWNIMFGPCSHFSVFWKPWLWYFQIISQGSQMPAVLKDQSWAGCFTLWQVCKAGQRISMIFQSRILVSPFHLPGASGILTI